MSSEEVRLARLWYEEDDLSPDTIAQRLRRNKSTLTRLLVKEVNVVGRGRKRSLSDANVDALIKHLEEMVDASGGLYEVTMNMLLRSARCKLHPRTVHRALRRRNIFFRRPRTKPMLTEDDVKARRQFARTHKDRSGVWWLRHVHMHIDVKHFQVFLHAGARTHAARLGVRGQYRAPGKGLSGAYVQVSKRLQYNPGARGVQVLAGVGNGKVLLWHYINGPWNSSVAAQLYTGPVRATLKRTYPSRRTWRVLEDNDPAGFESSKGKRAKKDAGIEKFRIPKRSPCLNVCDYALWKEVNKRMRKQELKWPATKTETRGQYLARLRRTAMRLPARFINGSIQDMQRRCGRLHAAKGRNFEEGGR